MSERNIGNFISELRKENSLTQKELAEKLGITDKAVSKWERGLSMPDISLLVPLSEILRVTTSELLNGSREEQTSGEMTGQILHYTKRYTADKIGSIRKYGFLIFLACGLLAILTCLICDYAINRVFSWSVIVSVSVLYGCIILYPLYKAGKPVRSIILMISIATIPYLLLLGLIISDKRVYEIGIPIVLLSIAAVWLMYGAFVRYYKRMYFAVGLVCIIALPLTVLINMYTDFYLQRFNMDTLFSTVINAAGCIVLAMFCFAFDRRKKTPS